MYDLCRSLLAGLADAIPCGTSAPVLSVDLRNSVPSLAAYGVRVSGLSFGPEDFSYTSVIATDTCSTTTWISSTYFLCLTTNLLTVNPKTGQILAGVISATQTVAFTFDGAKTTTAAALLLTRGVRTRFFRLWLAFADADCGCPQALL